jgi:UDP-glucuronate 4-epimerase
MPRVLITGAAGFIGMHTSIRFLTEGWEVIGLDNFNTYYSVKLKNDRVNQIKRIAKELENSFTIINADLNSSIWKTLNQYHFNAVIHLAAQAGVRYSIENPEAYLESNVLGFQKVLNFVNRNKIQRFVYASSSSVYGQDSLQPFNENESCNNPNSYYAATKKMNELMAKAYFNIHEQSSIGLRFFTVYGPWGRPDMAPMLFANAAFKNKPIKVFNFGRQRRDFTFIDDIVEGIFCLITMHNFPLEAEVCNIGNGSPVELHTFIEKIEKHTSLKLKKELVEAQSGDVTETYSNNAKVSRLTGYQPKTTLDEGMIKFIAWFKEYYDFKT